MIFPPVALPALPHGAAKDLTPAFTYMMLANLLHWPAGVVPVTLVRSEEEVRKQLGRQPRGGLKSLADRTSRHVVSCNVPFFF